MYKEIESHNLEGFRRVFDTFRKKAVSLGMPEPSYKVVAEKYRKIGEMPNCNVYSKVSIVELENVNIMVNGWQIVALIEPILKSDANAEDEALKMSSVNEHRSDIARYTVFENIPQELFETSPYVCDNCRHCSYGKMAAYILKNVYNNTYVQVHAKCIEPFTQVYEGKKIAAYMKAFSKLCKWGTNDLYRFTPYYSVRELIALAMYVNVKYTWVSNSVSTIYNVESSSEKLHELISGDVVIPREELEPYANEVDSVIDYYNSVINSEKPNSKFIDVTANVMTSAFVKGSESNFGRICYAVNDFIYTYGSNKPMEFIAPIGDTVKCDATLVNKRILDTRYGFAISAFFNVGTDRVNLLTGENTKFGKCLVELQTGSRVKLQATVKAHHERGNSKITELTRVTHFEVV